MSHISIFVRNASQWRKIHYLLHTPCHMCHSQNFDKIDSFLNPVLNMCILSSLIVGWGKWVIKEVAGILHQIYRFTGGSIDLLVYRFICILSSLIVRWGKWVIKEVAGILHQIYRFTGGVTIWGSRFHQKKSRYCLGPSQTSQVEIVFGYKPLTFYYKNLQLECLTGCIRRFQKGLFVFY